jgi:hypothetical protein
MATAKALARFVWAAPCSAVGVFAAVPALLAGGRARFVAGTVEVVLRETLPECGSLAQRFPFRAITFGHVILAVTMEDLDGCRNHELVHVRQYERWGPAFLPAYAMSSLWQLVRGRRPYWDNAFEVEARRLTLRTAQRLQAETKVD